MRLLNPLASIPEMTVVIMLMEIDVFTRNEQIHTLTFTFKGQQDIEGEGGGNLSTKA